MSARGAMVLVMIVIAVVLFGAFLAGLLNAAVSETPDEQAECIRRDWEERERKAREKEERRRMRKAGRLRRASERRKARAERQKARAKRRKARAERSERKRR